MTDALDRPGPPGDQPHDAARRAAALADVPLVSPAPRGGIRGILEHRYLLKLLVKREVTARYTGSFLGHGVVLHQPAHAVPDVLVHLRRSSVAA